MPKIWVLENPHHDGMVLSRALIGNFAIRCVASIDSFKRICRIEKRRIPDLIVVNCKHFQESVATLDASLSSIVNGAYRLYVRDAASSLEQMNDQAAVLALNTVDELLVGTVTRLANKITMDRSSHIFFKDIELNATEISMRIQPCENFDPVPNREFKLMRLFMSHPHKCFTREELRRLVWDGAVVASRTIDSQISRLRKRLSHSEASIESIYGGGYKLT